MEVSIEEIQQKFESLPEDLKWAIMAVKVDDKIIEIGQMRSLNVEQMGQLSLETHMVMFGFVHPDQFEASLKGSLKLPDDKTRELVNDVNEKILKSIRGKLMELHAQPTVRQAVNSAPVSAPAHPAEKGDDAILKKAGIEILPNAPEAPKVEQPVPASKLTDSVKSDSVKTEYTISNLSKTAELPSGAPEKGYVPAPKPSPAPSSYPPKGDPYRINPE